MPFIIFRKASVYGIIISNICSCQVIGSILEKYHCFAISCSIQKRRLFTGAYGMATPSVPASPGHLPRRGRQSTVSPPKGSLPEATGARRLREFLRNPTRKREGPFWGKDFLRLRLLSATQTPDPNGAGRRVCRRARPQPGLPRESRRGSHAVSVCSSLIPLPGARRKRGDPRRPSGPRRTAPARRPGTGAAGKRSGSRP